MLRITLGVLLAAVLSGCGKPELIVLLEGEDGSIGQLAVESNGETIVLNEAFEGAEFKGVGEFSAVDVQREAVYKDFAAALAATPEAPVSFLLYFKVGETTLVETSKSQLANIFAEIRSRQAPDVQVTGHTDRVGKVPDNDRLALDRANVVRDLLIASGLNPAMVSAVGRGERENLVATEDEVAEPRNRRVVVIVR